MKNGRDKDMFSKVSRYKKSIWARWSALFTLNHNIVGSKYSIKFTFMDLVSFL